MQWFVKGYRRLRRLWFLVQRYLLGLLPLFGGQLSKWRAWVTRRPRGSAVAGRSYLDRFVRAVDPEDHPIVGTLRSKATNELFDWLGLAMIPRQTWAILDKVGDPGATLEQLIRALGCDPLAARRREPQELARLEAAIDVLVDLDSLRPYLGAEHLGEIEYLLFAGDYDLVMNYSRIVAAHSALQIGRDRAARLRRFAAYDVFMRQVDRHLDDPWSLSPTEAEAVLRLSDSFVTAMERYTLLHGEITAALAALQALWPHRAVETAQSAERARIQRRFESLDGELVENPRLDPGRIDDLLAECAALLEACRTLLEKLEAEATGPGDGAAAQLSEADQALVFFGFAAASSPSWEEIKKAYRAVMKRLHPDLAAEARDPEEVARREEMSKRANVYRDLLRRRHPLAR